MQAGDRLNFVKPFDTARDTSDPTEEERRDHTIVMCGILHTMVGSRPENVDSIVLLEESQFITVREASYRLDMPDGSYLHILVYSQEDKGELLAAGIAVTEHLDDGNFNGGYMYTLDPTGVRRSFIPKDKDEIEMDSQDRTRPFSVIDLCVESAQLEELELSDDFDLRERAVIERAVLEEEVEFSRMAVLAGFDDLPPHEGELEKLAELILGAYHYPLRERDNLS